MSNTKPNTYANISFNPDITDPDYLEVFSTDDTYENISSVYKQNPQNDYPITSSTNMPNPSDTRGRQKIQISLWLLFLIIICILVAFVVTGIVTFFITKERFTVKQYESKAECYWETWSSWSGCSITCGKGEQFRVRQQMNTSMLCNYNESFNVKSCTSDPCIGDGYLIDMLFSRTASYKNVFISADNTILSNVHTIETSSSANAQLQNYKGTIADICVGNNELIYYEVNYTYTIGNTSPSNYLVLEVGLAERTKVDRYYYVGSKNVSGWSFHLAKSSHNNVYLYSQYVDSNHVWESFSNDTIGTKVHGKFKLFIDRLRNEFSLRQGDSIFHVFKNVTSSGKLCPVFAVFNPQIVLVKLQLMNPRNFTRFPW
ncbi:unnamed protein product [Mytilus coruscus]|uniref:THBS2S n=1 Tax=Mytilus coruscus TaxID=42192 RepID=A0A6J8DQD2_MYTCO|nr:unnamed protein product [Mytilus coruscus]